MPNPKATSFADDLAALAPQEGSSFASDLASAPKPAQSTHGATTMAAVKAAVPGLQQVVDQVATHPAMAKGLATIGEVVGGVKGFAVGAASGNPLSGAAVGSVAGEKTAKIAAKMAERVALKASPVLEAAAPYAQALGTLSGAQGVGDLAQMAEPTRTDIGFLGIGETQHVPGQEPALLNLLAQKLSDAVSYLMSKGMSQGEATKTVMNLKVKAGK